MEQLEKNNAQAITPPARLQSTPNGNVHRLIKVNKIRCRNCQDTIESIHRHDFVYCSCGSIFVDGGQDYLRRGGNLADIEELSEYE